MGSRRDPSLRRDVVVSSNSGGIHFSRAYSRASTPVSPQVSMASASGMSTTERHPSSSNRQSPTPPLPSFPQFSDALPNTLNSTSSSAQTARTGVLSRTKSPRPKSPRPKSPNIPTSYSRLFPPLASRSARRPVISKSAKQQSGTEHLIRQVFLPKESHQLDWRDKLPLLTSSDQVNIEIYAFFGLICRQFIQAWYYKIVDDPAFIYDISAVLAHVTRQIEERVVQIDMFELALDELPTIIEAYIKDVRMVHARYKSSLLPADSIESAFHAIRPHPALGSAEDERAFLQMLSRGLVVSLLDQASLNSPLAVSLISSIICDIGLKNAVEKLSEPWMLYEIFTKVLNILCPPKPTEEEKPEVKAFTATASVTSGGLTTQAGALYTRVVSICGSALTKGGRLFAFLASFAGGEELSYEKTRVPLVGTSIFSLIDTLFQFNTKKPLLPASLKVMSIPFAYGRLGKICNRVVDFFLSKSIGNEQAIAKILSTVRGTLFPNNGPMGPGRPFPSDEEQATIRATASNRLLTAVPESARFVLYGDDPQKSVDGILDLFGNKYMNKHLVYNLLDHLVSKVAPELVEMTPQELLNSKLGTTCNLT